MRFIETERMSGAKIYWNEEVAKYYVADFQSPQYFANLADALAYAQGLALNW